MAGIVKQDSMSREQLEQWANLPGNFEIAGRRDWGTPTLRSSELRELGRTALELHDKSEKYRKVLDEILSMKEITFQAAKLRNDGTFLNQFIISFNLGAMIGAAMRALQDE